MELGCTDEILTIVAMLSVETPYYRPKDKQAQADMKKAKFFQVKKIMHASSLLFLPRSAPLSVGVGVCPSLPPSSLGLSLGLWASMGAGPSLFGTTRRLRPPSYPPALALNPSSHPLSLPRNKQIEGDHLTLLAVYEGWKNAKFSNPWCFENFLQARAMKRAQVCFTVFSLFIPPPLFYFFK